LGERNNKSGEGEGHLIVDRKVVGPGERSCKKSKHSQEQYMHLHPAQNSPKVSSSIQQNDSTQHFLETKAICLSRGSVRIMTTARLYVRSWTLDFVLGESPLKKESSRT